MFAEVMIAARVVGLNEYPVLLGVTAYVPADKPLKLYAPDVFVFVVAVAAPLSDTVAELPPAAGLTVPDIEKVCPPGVCGTTLLLGAVTLPEQPIARRAIIGVARRRIARGVRICRVALESRIGLPTRGASCSFKAIASRLKAKVQIRYRCSACPKDPLIALAESYVRSVCYSGVDRIAILLEASRYPAQSPIKE
jgi:hypothetical protein